MIKSNHYTFHSGQREPSFQRNWIVWILFGEKKSLSALSHHTEGWPNKWWKCAFAQFPAINDSTIPETQTSCWANHFAEVSNRHGASLAMMSKGPPNPPQCHVSFQEIAEVPYQRVVKLLTIIVPSYSPAPVVPKKTYPFIRALTLYVCKPHPNQKPMNLFGSSKVEVENNVSFPTKMNDATIGFWGTLFYKNIPNLVFGRKKSVASLGRSQKKEADSFIDSKSARI